MATDVPTRTGAVFDHAGLCISRGADFASDEELQRAAAAVRLLLRCRLLTSKSGSASAVGGGSLAASLDPATAASPFLPRTRSGTALNQRPGAPLYESGTLGSSLGTDSTPFATNGGYTPTSITVESTHEALHVQATESHISVVRVALPAVAST
jgi:hypothetical protein